MAQERIKHVVVLMLENRSFDHMLGYLDQGKGRPPLSTDDGVPMDPSKKGSAFVPIEWLTSYSDVTVDPGHGYEDVMRQLTGTNGGWSSPYTVTNDGFVWNYAARKNSTGRPPASASEIMGCYSRELLPALSTLANAFAVCTRWHCSLPSETWPNRLFAHAGTSFGGLKFDKLQLPDLVSARTIFDLLREVRLESRVYAGDIPQVLTFGWDVSEFRHMRDFEADVRDGDLPEYTLIEPRYFDTPFFGKSNSQHPVSNLGPFHSSGYVPLGEVLIAQVYTALRSNSDIWKHSLLIVTYDEHGGFYDRVPPPQVPPTGDVASNGFRFDLLGPRVPALAVSPYVRAGVIESEMIFDHTSLTKTVRELFDIRSPLSEREGSANTLTTLLDLSTARDPDEQPSLEKYINEDWFPELEALDDRPLDDFQRQLLDLASAVDIEIRAELAITEETSVRDVAGQVERFVERNYPPRQGLYAGGGETVR